MKKLKMDDSAGFVIDPQHCQTRSERTLALIKPEALQHEEDIMNVVIDNGFQVIARRRLKLTPEQASDFYHPLQDSIEFPHIVAQMSFASIIALCLAKPNAIQSWRKIIGPTRVDEARAYWPDCLRARFGQTGPCEGQYYNAVHGSSDHAEAARELRFFFNQMVVGPILRGVQLREYLQTTVNPLLSKGLAALCLIKPEDPVVWLAEWLLANNPNRPQIKVAQPRKVDEPPACEPTAPPNTPLQKICRC